MNPFPSKKCSLPRASVALVFCWTVLATPLRAQQEGIAPSSGRDLSLKLEVGQAIARGLSWLRKAQNQDSGAWSDDKHPALTALSLCAFLGDPERDARATLPDDLRRGFDFLLEHQQADGGIYDTGLATYNTSLCLLALTLADNPDFYGAMVRAREFLIGLQADYDTPGAADNALDGGIGYGGSHTHSDLSNTHLALEALYYSRNVLADSPLAPGAEGSSELDWDAAIEFVQRCQHLPGFNDQSWASDDRDNRGGFVYFPGDSKAGEQVLPGGKVVPRSYGSMSYAGLLSFIYAEMDRSDPRIVAAIAWLKAHYSVDENPGMEHEGLFYYYHTMAKALNISNIEELELGDGSKADWRGDLAGKLFDLQNPEGFWQNDSGRWWEKDPVLVTAYSVLALEHIFGSL